MTDNKIIKALECCKGADTDCWECELFDSCKLTVQEIMQNALDLINRLTAENERLNGVIKLYRNYDTPFIKYIKSDAIKQVIKKAKDYLHEAEMHGNYEPCITIELLNMIENEMIGE